MADSASWVILRRVSGSSAGVGCGGREAPLAGRRAGRIPEVPGTLMGRIPGRIGPPFVTGRTILPGLGIPGRGPGCNGRT